VKAFVFVAVAGLAGSAHANPKAAPAPDKWAKAAREAFTQATEFDQKGDLRSALGLYTKAFEISPHSSCIFNIADVQRRLGKIEDAIKAYETYLAMWPDAPDRKDVESLIGKLAATPGTLVLTTGSAANPDAVDFKNAYVVVDGEIKLRPGTEAKAARDGGPPSVEVKVVGSGDHVVEIITAITYATKHCKVRAGQREDCYVSAKPRVDGRFVVGSGDRGLRVRDIKSRERKGLEGTRFELPPGKHRLTVRDRNFECAPITIDVPAGADVGYVFVTTREYERLERCRTIDVKALRFKFDP
jgi:tetratricopeptide (TPR) repeat protein